MTGFVVHGPEIDNSPSLINQNACHSVTNQKCKHFNAKNPCTVILTHIICFYMKQIINARLTSNPKVITFILFN